MHNQKTMRRLRMLRQRQYSAEQERQRLEAVSGSGSRLIDLARQPGIPLDQWQDQRAANRERDRRENRNPL